MALFAKRCLAVFGPIWSNPLRQTYVAPRMKNPPIKRKLSPLDATRLRPKAKTFQVWDSLERGLCLQIQPTGYRAFKFVYQYKRVSRWFHIGSNSTPRFRKRILHQSRVARRYGSARILAISGLHRRAAEEFRGSAPQGSLSHPDQIERWATVGYLSGHTWHIASFRFGAEFGRLASGPRPPIFPNIPFVC